MDKEEVRMIEHLKRIFNNLDQHWHSIQLLLGHVSKPLTIDDRGLAVVVRQLSDQIKINVECIKNIDLIKTFGEIKYIGKRLNKIENILQEIQKNGVEKKIRVDLTLDGYEMTKKKIKNKYDEQENEKNDEYEHENLLKELLSTLSERESKVLIHRFGLLGEKKKTLRSIGTLFNVSGDRIRQIESKALRKLRHPKRLEHINLLTHLGLRKAVTGD